MLIIDRKFTFIICNRNDWSLIWSLYCAIILIFLWYYNIIFKNSTKYDRSDFILLKNVFWYSIMSLRLCPSKNTPFCIIFYLYPKQLSHFRAVLERIPACRSISLFSHTVLHAKIDCSSPSSVSNSSYTSSGQFAYKYPFTNWAKEYEVIPNILLIILIGKH